MCLNRKTCYKEIKWGKLQQITKLTEDIFEKKTLDPGGCLPLSRGYMHVNDHYFQTSFSLKPLGQSNVKFYVEPSWEEGTLIL